MGDGSNAVPAWWCVYTRFASSELKGSRLLERPDKEQWCARGLQTTSCLLVSLQEVTWLLHPAQSGFVLWLGFVWITQNQWRDKYRRLLPSFRFLDIKGDTKEKKSLRWWQYWNRVVITLHKQSLMWVWCCHRKVILHAFLPMLLSVHVGELIITTWAQ